MIIAMLVLSFLILVTTFVVSFQDAKPFEHPGWIAAFAMTLMYLAVSLMWPLIFESRVIPNLLPRVLASTFFSGSAALWARLFIRARRRVGRQHDSG